MNRFALVVHDSDEVKDVFIGVDKETILVNLKISKYWKDIVERLEEAYGEDEDFPEDEVTLDTVTELHHDGDSEDGYTLLQTK